MFGWDLMRFWPQQEKVTDTSTSMLRMSSNTSVTGTLNFCWGTVLILPWFCFLVQSNRGLRTLLLKNIPTGIGELSRSIFLAPYLKMLQEYIPSIRSSDIDPSYKAAGVRALALDETGKLVSS